MPDRGPRASRAEIVLLAALAAWGLFPIVLLLVHAAALHARFTGADGLIGADGVLGADQLQYLAWARDAAAHGGLTSDLFSIAPSSHVYLQPMFAVSGALYRLGLSLPLAYLLWKPIAIVALFLAAVAWARRMFGAQLGQRAAAVALSLFLYIPLTALFSWTQLGSGSFRFQLYLLASELLVAGKLWGYVASALGLALVPTTLLAVDRALDRRRVTAPARRTLGGRVERGPLILGAVAALLASWLHPWQGITLIVIFVGLAVWSRLRHAIPLAVPAIGAALPLAYYYLLSHHDAAWHLASRYEAIPRLSAPVLLAGLGPLALIALLGVRRPGDVLVERALPLWVAGCFVTYFANDAFAAHAFQGLSFPWAILAVRGWGRLRLPAALGVVAVALVTIPGLVYDGRKFARTANSRTVQYYLTAGDAAALDWVQNHAPPGGVLAPTPFAAVVPAQTGRAVWVGHGYWSHDYPVQARQADRLFGGRMAPAVARRFVAGTGASILVSDCRHRADLARPLRPLLGSVRRFGCARVYLLAPARPGRSARR
ncbi:MAG TPA: hypothetical protein VG365_17505 [Solirubrobacteraceae bacterium]|nr:hypothetical protein [Solirubrobacteraceae bacterium]